MVMKFGHFSDRGDATVGKISRIEVTEKTVIPRSFNHIFRNRVSGTFPSRFFMKLKTIPKLKTCPKPSFCCDSIIILVFF